jgi:hypothetical protein
MIRSSAFSRALRAAAASWLLLAACGPAPVATPTIPAPATMTPIDTTSDLVAALRAASGGPVSQDGAAPPQFGIPGVVLRLGEEAVDVYAFPDSASRATAQSEIDPQGPTFQGRPLAGWAHPRIWGVGRLLVVYDGGQGGTFLLLSGLLGDPLPAGAASSAGPDEPYPPAVSAAIVSLAHAETVDPGQVEVLSYSAATWPDGCLGVPGGSTTCQAGEVQGWLVDLRIGKSRFEVHTDGLGQQVRWR